jgi:hypothetical protein
MFYVYEHIRPDTGKIFYVGKGKKYRHKSKSDRNFYWKNIVAKAGGFDARIIFENEDNELILLCEQERIDQLKRIGIKLCNLTTGGEGLAGFAHSEETKQKIKEKAKSRPKRNLSTEHKEALRKANTGIKFTEERKKKIAEKAKGRKLSQENKEKLRLALLGFKHTEETKQHLRKINLGRKHKPETIVKMSEFQRSRKRNFTPDQIENFRKAHLGKTHSEESKAKMSAAVKARPRVQCQYCKRLFSPQLAARYHLDKCKMKGNNDE